MPDNEPLKVDRNPSAKAEAESFENPDERLQATANARTIQYHNIFNSITDNLFKLVLTVAGYVFGTQHAK
jgi:hypothetical protein